MYPDSFHIFPRSIQYESSRTSEVGGNDFWELGGPNDVKICLVVDKSDVHDGREWMGMKENEGEQVEMGENGKGMNEKAWEWKKDGRIWNRMNRVTPETAISGVGGLLLSSAHQSIYPFVHHLSIFRFNHPNIHLFILQFIYYSFSHLFIHPSTCFNLTCVREE